MIKALVLIAATMGEHWVCAIPNKLEPPHTIIFDLQVAGDRLVQSLPVETGYLILRNDDQAITAVRMLSFLPEKVADVVGIDKQRGLFKLMQVYFGESDDVASAGDCKKMGDGESP
jgi:hypothetical protein